MDVTNRIIHPKAHTAAYALIQRRLEARVAEWEAATTAEGRRAAEEAIEFLNETLREMAAEK